MSSSIARRIRNMVVAIPYGLETMLSLLDIVETEEVPTAAVPLGGRPCILINPTFVAQHCETDEKLFVLIMHELHHVLLGHTRLFQRVTPQHNVAFDAVINAMLCRTMPEDRWTALFREQYRADEFPFCLLRPPRGFPQEAIFENSLPADIKQIIQNLYYGNSGTFLEVFEAVCRKITAIPNPVLARLLGNHEADNRGLEHQDNPELFTVVKRIVAEWPQPPTPLRGRSLNDVLEKCSFEPRTLPQPHAVVSRAIRLAATKSGSHNGTVRHPHSQTVQQFWPTRDRRAFFQVSTGFLLPIYTGVVYGEKSTREAVQIYIDVSGSMIGYRDDILRGVLSCQHEIKSEVFLFSTTVVPIRLSDLSKGVFESTGGTDLGCVIQHLQNTGPTAAVILTDGYVGSIPASAKAALVDRSIQVVLTPSGYQEDLRDIANGFHYFYGGKK